MSLYGMVSQSNESIPLRSVLLCAAAEIELYGWHPSTAGMDKATGRLIPLPPGSEPPTRDKVLGHFVGPEEIRQEYRQALGRAAKDKNLDLFSTEFQKGVDDAIEWARGLSSAGNYDYHQRISQIASQDRITVKDVGLAVSILTAYAKQKKAATGASQFLGVKNESLSVDLTITALAEFDDHYSDPFASPSPKRTRVTGIQVGTENVVAFYTKGSITELNLQVNDKVSVSGRVKDHHVYKSVNETVLNFAKFHKS